MTPSRSPSAPAAARRHTDSATHAAAADTRRTRAASARALLVTIYGLYARDRDGALSVAALVRLLGALDVDGPAARSLISRLKARGILEPVAVGSGAGYGLTDAGRTLLEEGDRRIYGGPRTSLADGWLLAVFSVPESQRAQRHSLRARLSALGFGTVSAGVWIAPAHLKSETADVLRLHQLDQYVELFMVTATGSDPTDAVARWWDLGALAALYRAFVDQYAPVLARWRHGTPSPDGTPSTRRRPAQREASGRDEAAFADYVTAVTAWRRLPYRDPGLPTDVLPADWPGNAAAALFGALRDTLAIRAERHVAASTGLSATR